MEYDTEQASPANDVNDLFDYDVGLDAIFQGDQAAVSNGDTAKAPGNTTSLGLGLDEEVKVSKKRQPVAKLDEDRLLSQPGIPKLRRTAKQKLKFKGKGHEFADAARLLNFYQLWLDDLFPRAKFADGLTIIEKLGHTKRMQTMRREWIDEERRKVSHLPETSQDVLETRDLPTRLTADSTAAAVEISREQSSSRPPLDVADTTDQELFIQDPKGLPRPPAVSQPEPDDDELDDLLREQDEIISKGPEETVSGALSGVLTNLHDDFDAEYEAMNELGI